MRIPLSLSVYEHAAAIVGVTPWEASRDAELCLRAHREAWLLYRHFPVVVGIDIYNLEAEALGGEVRRAEGVGIPAITEPIARSCSEAMGLPLLDPGAGRIPMMIEVGRGLADEFPEADIRIPVGGPFSVAQSVVGLNQLMLDVAMEPGAVRSLLERLVDGQVGFARAVIEQGLGVAFFESAAAPPLLSPAQFREVEAPALQRAMREVGEIAGAAIPCIIGGDTAPLVPELLATGTGFLICPAETDRERFLAATMDAPEVAVRVNLDPAVYARGSEAEIFAAVDEVVALARTRPNVLLGTGAIPYETPPEKLLVLKRYCEG
ncbi:MAG: uroporphyrinogen decarboxylase family protein [Armatimonadota bacterium]|jgi:uroporphyrinogen decarboxylase